MDTAAHIFLSSIFSGRFRSITSSSVTFTDAKSTFSNREKATAGNYDDSGPGEGQDLPLSLDPSLQQGMIEYVSDLRELLAAQLISQDEFTQWVLRKAGGAVLEEQLREVEGEEVE